jgi:uncharacterized protein YicC (UPF0701 family)
MLKSMTGFGAGRAKVGDEEFSVELRSLNHKFCEVKVRLPRELAALESVAVKQVKDRLARGSVEVFVKRQTATAAGTVPVVDGALAREYARALREVGEAIGVQAEVSWTQVASQPGVMRLEERGMDVESATQAAQAALDHALTALEQMRRVEGEAIHGISVDAQRLAQEVAVFAERTDIAEEMTRLSSHLEQFRQMMAGSEPAGRRMDFLVQEMHREVNTTGSKSQHAEISARVVSMKAEVERIREQVQNVE